LLGRPSADIIERVLDTHPSYIAALFDAIDAKYPTIDTYFEAELAIDRAGFAVNARATAGVAHLIA
jgi:hypothetical protein